MASSVSILLLGKEPAHIWWIDFEQKNLGWVKRINGRTASRLVRQMDRKAGWTNFPDIWSSRRTSGWLNKTNSWINESTNRMRMYSPLFLYICSLSRTWDPEDVHCVWNYSVRILWLLEIRWPLIRYSWRIWVPCSIELSRSLAQGIPRFVSSGLWAVCQGK